MKMSILLALLSLASCGGAVVGSSADSEDSGAPGNDGGAPQADARASGADTGGHSDGATVSDTGAPVDESSEPSDGDSTVTETCAFPPASANACVLCKGEWYCSWQLNHEQPIPTCPVNITLNQKGCTIGCVQCLDGGSIAVQWGCTEDMYIFPTTNGLSCAY